MVSSIKSRLNRAILIGLLGICSWILCATSAEAEEKLQGYIGLKNGGIVKYDFSEREQPTRISSTLSQKTVQALSRGGGSILAGTKYGEIYQIRDRGSDLTAKQLANVNCRLQDLVRGKVTYYFLFQSNYTYLACRRRGLVVLDSDYNVIHKIDVEGYARTLIKQGSYVYLGSSSHYRRQETETGTRVQSLDDGGLIVYTANDPEYHWSAPNEKATNIYGMTLQENTLYLANGAGGLFVMDIFDPEDPQRIGEGYTRSGPVDVSIRNGRAYVADGGFNLIEVRPDKLTVLKDSYEFEVISGVEVDLPYVYLTDKDHHSMYILKVSDDSFQVIKNVPLTKSPRDFLIFNQ